MDEVDDILNQNRVPEEGIEEDEEDEDEDDTMLGGNIEKVNSMGQEEDQDQEQDQSQDQNQDEDDVINDGEEDDEAEPGDDDADDDDDEDEDEDEDEDVDDDDDEDDDEDEVEDEVEDEDEAEDDEDGDEEDEDNNNNNDTKLNGSNGGNKKDEEKSSTNGDSSRRNGGVPEGNPGSSNNKESIDENEDATKNEDKDEDMNKLNGIDKVHNYYTQMLRSAKIADTYNIYPTAAIPIQTNVNALTMSKGLEYLFLGGDDGFIRKYDFLNTVDGKLSLTILQKHSLSESIQNAGILLSYWENEVPQKRSQLKVLKNNKEYEPKVSSVYSLEVQSECLFILSGLDNGGITLQGVRYMEGTIGHYFKGRNGHSSIVNLLKINGDETKFLSGSWDKRILEWDLQSGNLINEFKGSTSELSSLELRPIFSTADINEVATKMKNELNDGQQSAEKDDDMDSLFGEDEEDKSTVNIELDREKENKDSDNEIDSEEISKSTLNVVYDDSVFMSSGLNGTIHIWDRRTPSNPVLSLERGPKVPPWCQSACWSMDGDRVYAGRRNAIVEEFELKMPSKPSNVLKLPTISGPVTCVRAMPNNKQVLCASRDNIRLYNTVNNTNSKGTAVPFLIVPGHHGGVISNMYVDPTCRFLITTSGNRGWQGTSTDTTFIYEIDLN